MNNSPTLSFLLEGILIGAADNILPKLTKDTYRAPLWSLSSDWGIYVSGWVIKATSLGLVDWVGREWISNRYQCI